MGSHTCPALYLPPSRPDLSGLSVTQDGISRTGPTSILVPAGSLAPTPPPEAVSPALGRSGPASWLTELGRRRFSPDLLGLQASSALAWPTVEVLAILLSLYLITVNTDLSTIDLVAFLGYKYVG